MSWIKVRTELHESPTVVRIVSRLCRAESATSVARQTITSVVMGGLIRVWGLADTHTTDGVLVGYTPDLIDEMVGMPGFCEAVAAEDWMMIEPQALVIPEFEKHNGESAKKRALNTQRQKLSRETRDQCRAETATREEKRREEKKRTPPPTPSARAPKARAKAGTGRSEEEEEVFRAAKARGIGAASEVCRGLNPKQFAIGCEAADFGGLGNGWLVDHYCRPIQRGETPALPDGFKTSADREAEIKAAVAEVNSWSSNNGR